MYKETASGHFLARPPRLRKQSHNLNGWHTKRLPSYYFVTVTRLMQIALRVLYCGRHGCCSCREEQAQPFSGPLRSLFVWHRLLLSRKESSNVQLTYLASEYRGGWIQIEHTVYSSSYSCRKGKAHTFS